MNKKSNISMAVIRRLPKYHKYLEDMIQKDIHRISSNELSKKIGFTPSQIRQDLNCFGDFGQQGYGYNVKDLYNEINTILGLDRQYNMILIGAGNIGQAIGNYTKFSAQGFNIKGIFDSNPKLIGNTIKGIEIQDIDNLGKFLESEYVDIGVICVPASNAQKICDILVKCNIKGIWNFAPVDLNVPEDIIVENIRLSESLMTLSYLINQNDVTEE